MADEVVGLRIEVDSNAGEAVASLRTQLKQAQAEVSAMAEKFGETSVEAANAAKKAAELKDKIGDAKALTEAFSPDKKFQALSSALSGVAGGFAAVQGAMGLLGSENEELEKSLLKVQSAMALSQGLSAITEAGDAFKNLKVVAVNALNSIKTAIGSTGIGLLVIALGAIYAYWDDIKEAVNGVSAEQEKLNEKTKANLDTEKQKLTQLNSQDNILKLQGKSEKDILKIKLTQYDAVIKATEAQIAQSEITKNAQVAAAERNKEILKGLLNFLSIPITAVLYAVDQVRNALGGTSTLLEDYKEGLAKMVFDPEQVKKDGDKQIQEQKNALQTLKNDRAGFQLQIQEIDKEAADKRAKELQEQRLKESAHLEEIQKNTVENLINNSNRTRELQGKLRLAQIQDEKERAKVENEIKLQDELLAETERYKKGEVRLEQYLINISLIRKRYEEESKNQQEKESQEKLKNQSDKLLKESELTDLSFNDRLAKIQERIALENQIVFASEEERTAFQKANSEARKKIVEEEANSKIEQAQRAADLLDGISSLIGKQTAAGKAAAVASTIINTYAAAQLAFKNAQLNPISILGSAYPYIQAGLAIAAGVKNVQQILSVPVPNGGGGGGGSVPSAGGYSFSSGGTAPISPQTNVVTTQLTNQNLNELKNNTVKAYVVESEMTDAQTRIRRIQQAAEFGG